MTLFFFPSLFSLFLLVLQRWTVIITAFSVMNNWSQAKWNRSSKRRKVNAYSKEQKETLHLVFKASISSRQTTGRADAGNENVMWHHDGGARICRSRINKRENPLSQRYAWVRLQFKYIFLIFCFFDFWRSHQDNHPCTKINLDTKSIPKEATRKNPTM